jgi:NADPH:quinone reductase-like Zn-dependent oxidoreductase
MKAFIVDRYGKNERLRAGEVPEPDLRADEVLIQVDAAAVNLLDVKLRNGEFKRKTRWRSSPGTSPHRSPWWA